MLLLVVAGATALGLGIVGVYGVTSYVVGRRTQEIGLRLRWAHAHPTSSAWSSGTGCARSCSAPA